MVSLQPQLLHRQAHQQRKVTGCLLFTPRDNLPELADTKSAKLRLKRATIALAHLGKELNHLLLHRLHSRLIEQ